MIKLELNDFAIRQIQKMLWCVDEFENEKMGVSVLYGNLEFLWLQIQDSYENPDAVVTLDSIQELEFLYAAYLEKLVSGEGFNTQSKELVKTIQNQLLKLDLNFDSRVE